MKYEQFFKHMLTETPVNVSPQDNEIPDGDVWAEQNPEIQENPELSGQFDVKDISVDMGEEYTQKIKAWREKLNVTTDDLEEMHRFAVRIADEPGAGEIHSAVGSIVERLITDLSTLDGHLRTLADKVVLAMRREKAKENK